MNVLITGHSRGLGAGLARHYLAAGASVFGLSRGTLGAADGALREVAADLADEAAIAPALDRLLPAPIPLDLVFLNAGVLGEIANLCDTPLAELRAVMDVNVWANKIVLDWLAARAPAPGQVIAISSGASVSGHHGWGAYALSKATLNMLMRLYAHELPDTHLLALAPGLVHTEMQDTLQTVDTVAFPAIERLQQAMGTDAMPSPDVVAGRIAALLPGLRERPSGSFVDIRKL